MPASESITAEQAAQAIILLSSNHATADAYLYSMDGEGMTRAEFKQYLRGSSQEEYLDLLRGHLPDECATLVRKAADVQKKRKDNGHGLSGRKPAEDTAEKFFNILELNESQGLSFDHVKKIIVSTSFPDKSPATPKPTVATNAPKDPDRPAAQASTASKIAESSINPTAAGNADTDDKSEHAQNGVQADGKKSKERKAKRAEAFALAQAEKAKKAKDKAEAKRARRAERKRLQAAGESDATFEATEKKNSVGSTDPSTNAPAVQDVTASKTSSATAAADKKSKKRKLDSEKSARDAAFVDKVNASASNATPTEKEKANNAPSNPPTKKQKTTVDPVNLSATGSGSAPDASHTPNPTQGKSGKRARRRAKRASMVQQAKERPSGHQQATEDVKMASPGPEAAQSVPAPTQETTDFVSAVEPEDSLNDKNESDLADSSDMFRPGRTALPTLERKTWIAASPSPSSKESRTTPEAIPDVQSNSANGIPTSETAPVSQSSGRARQEAPVDESSVEPSDTNSEDGNLDDIATLPNETSTTRQMRPSSNPHSVKHSATAEANRVTASDRAKSAGQSPSSSIGWLTSQSRLPGRSSLGLGQVPSTFPSIGLSRTNAGNTSTAMNDPSAALKNLNKFLNNGNSSDESDSDEDSGSDSGDEPPSKPQPAPPQVAPVQKVHQQSKPEDGRFGPSNEGSTKERVSSFSSINDDAPRTTYEASPSPEIPDLPSLMDQGGYVPQLSSGGYSSSNVRSGHAASDASNAMEIDLLSPFKNRDPAQGSVEGIVRPSEIVEYNSSPPLSGAPMSNELETDGTHFSLEQQTTLDDAGSKSELDNKDAPNDDGDDVIQDGPEELATQEGDVSILDTLPSELKRQDGDYRRNGTSFLAPADREHNTDDDQVMASSQLLGEASAGLPSWRSGLEAGNTQSIVREESPKVIIYVSPKNVSKSYRIPEAQSPERADSAPEQLDNHDEGDDYEGSGEIDVDVDSTKDEEDSVSSRSGPKASIHASESEDDALSDPPDSPSSVEWDEGKYGDESEEEAAPSPAPDAKQSKKRKSTGTTSRHFSTTPEKKKAGKRVAAGVSSVPFPRLSAPRFGLMQEKMYQNPFQMLCAVLFLNKTKGSVAKDIIMEVLEKWPTPEALSKAQPKELLAMIETLGLQNERTKKLIKLAEIFVADPPQKGRRHRTLNYPQPGDGKVTREGKKTSPKQILEEDFDEVEGFLEIGHLYGAGPYAWDSWRIFCRDMLRGVAEGYNGEGVEGYNSSEPRSQCTFEPEWKRVVPKDKELRACLRWMWLREGWDWDPLTGSKRPASVQKIREASQGIAEWTEPVAFNPHGVETEDGVEVVKKTDPSALVDGQQPHEEVLETTEKPLEAMVESAAKEEPVAPGRATRRCTRDSNDNQGLTPQSRRIKKEESANGAPEQQKQDGPTPKQGVRRSLRSLEKRAPASAATTAAAAAAATAAESPAAPTPSSERLSPRSIRKLKAEFMAEYKASQSGTASSPVTQSPLVSAVKRRLDGGSGSSPVKKRTRQK